jgi:hypothetical protein
MSCPHCIHLSQLSFITHSLPRPRPSSLILCLVLILVPKSCPGAGERCLHAFPVQHPSFRCLVEELDVVRAKVHLIHGLAPRFDVICAYYMHLFDVDELSHLVATLVVKHLVIHVACHAQTLYESLLRHDGIEVDGFDSNHVLFEVDPSVARLGPVGKGFHVQGAGQGAAASFTTCVENSWRARGRLDVLVMALDPTRRPRRNIDNARLGLGHLPYPGAQLRGQARELVKLFAPFLSHGVV